MTTTLAVGNQKGGVGKTTTTWVLGQALTELGRTVLLVDVDPQSSLTIAAGIDAQERSMAQVLGGAFTGTLKLQEIVVKLGDQLYLAPSDIALANQELGLIQRTAREAILTQVLVNVRTDYILIDCPPSLGILTLNALVASDQILIPTQCEYLALRGLALFCQTLRKVQSNERLNPELKIFGILPTFYDSRLLHSDEVIDTMERQGLPVLPVRIRRSVRFAESALAHETILDYAPRNPSVDEYRKLARLVENGTG